MVFQNYALYPHMTVADNMAFSLQAARRAEGGDRRRGSSAPPTSSASAPYLERYPAPALRRPAPARRHGPRHRARSAGVPVRRAAVQPRRQAARADAHRDQGAAPAAQDHDGLRHPRPDRGDDHGRQDRGDARRPGRADRRAARALRPAGQPVRRRLHRLAGDELPQGHGAASTAAPRSKARTACSLPLDDGAGRCDGRPAVYGIRPEHFAIADDGAEAEIAGGRADRLGDPGRRQARRRGDRSRCSASATSSSRATRSGSNPIRGSFICSTRRRASD